MRTLAVAVMVVALGATACSSNDGRLQMASTTVRETADDGENGVDAAGTDAPAASVSPQDTAKQPEPTTTPPPEAILDQLDGLRDYQLDEACPATLAVLNSPDFPQETRDQLATGYSSRVAASGVVELVGVISGNPTSYRYWFASPTAAIEVSESAYLALIPAGGMAPAASFERSADGTYSCSQYTIGHE